MKRNFSSEINVSEEPDNITNYKYRKVNKNNINK